jgi:hypothetical protein
MTESEFTQPIVKAFKDAGVICFKLSDRFTTGVPDTANTAVGFTTWMEMKVLDEGETLYDRINEDKVQFFNMKALSIVGRACYVVKLPNQDRMLIVPGRIFAAGNMSDARIMAEAKSFHLNQIIEDRYSNWMYPIITGHKNFGTLLSILRMPA